MVIFSLEALCVHGHALRLERQCFIRVDPEWVWRWALVCTFGSSDLGFVSEQTTQLRF
jgi:hypothetical protein